MRRMFWFTIGLAAVSMLVLLARGRHTPLSADVAEPSDQTGDVAPGANATDPWPLPAVLIDPSVVISKSERRLTLSSDGAAVKGYRIALGSEPSGIKEREGDGRTPEGSYYVCSKNPVSAHHRALGLSYPGVEDAARGLNSGLISKREHRAIVEAAAHMKRPPWNTALGSEIMIHGGGTHSDWTAGCIALADGDVAELYDALPLGTPVVIEP